jgi:hypothetical protein
MLDVPCGPAIAPPGLKSLALKLYACHITNQDADWIVLHSDHASLYDLIQPSFSTLVELRIRPLFPMDSTSWTFDLRPLKPVGRTLQKFSYKAPILDPDMLNTIPEVFPHLTSLELMFWSSLDLDSPWKVRMLSALDFELACDCAF